MEQKHVLVIGPSRPQIGGIVDANNALCELLSKNNKVTRVGFSRLFPNWFFKEPPLYPEAPTDPPNRLIDTLRPSTWNKACDFILEQKPDIVFVHWWTTYLSPCYWYIQYRLKGKIPIRAIIHDVYPHGVEEK
jgi:hypothetical protein